MAKRVRLVAILVAVLALIGAPVTLIMTGALPYRAYVVQTGSMNPTIPPESLVVVHLNEYSVGQVITFIRDGAVVTHRLMAVTVDGSLVTRGDANEADDASAVPVANVIGGVVASPARLGYWIVYFQNPLTLGSLILCALSVWTAFSSDDDDQPDEQPVSVVAAAA